MNCTNQPSGNDQRVVSPTTKNIMQRTKNESWLNKKDIVQRTLWFSNHVVRARMKTTGKGSPAAREPIVNRTRNTSEITDDNSVKTVGNESTNIEEVIIPRMRNASDKDPWTKTKENKREYRAFGGLRSSRGCQKLETILVPSTLRIPTVKT